MFWTIKKKDNDNSNLVYAENIGTNKVRSIISFDNFLI